MASKQEKKLGIIIGMAIGCLKGNRYCKIHDISNAEKWKYIIGGGVGGGAVGYVAALVLGSADDTVNYCLFKGRRPVYHGITLANRLDARKNEHLRRGLIFDKVLKDKPKARQDARLLEKKRIKKHHPIYNIQHNYKAS